MKIISRVKSKMRALGTKLLNINHTCYSKFGWPKPPFYCPACKSHIWNWVPFSRAIGHGETKLEPGGRLCPACGSLERTRHFALYLEQENMLNSLPRMLHFAPEKSLENIFRKSLGDRYITTDLFMPGVDFKEDITRMGFPDESFDLIYCSNVLEHIPDDRAAMKEIFRVLSRGGRAIIQVPIKGKVTYEDPNITDPRERYLHFGQEDHVRYYGEDIDKQLKDAGFQVNSFYMLDVLKNDSKEIFKMNLDKRELIHSCIKK